MDNRVLFGVMCIIFNAIGVPCFMQGKVGKGIVRIVLGFVTFGIISVINEIMGIIQGIKILCMSDEEYAAADKEEYIEVLNNYKKQKNATDGDYIKETLNRAKVYAFMDSYKTIKTEISAGFTPPILDACAKFVGLIFSSFSLVSVEICLILE